MDDEKRLLRVYTGGGERVVRKLRSLSPAPPYVPVDHDYCSTPVE